MVNNVCKTNSYPKLWSPSSRKKGEKNENLSEICMIVRRTLGTLYSLPPAMAMKVNGEYRGFRVVNCHKFNVASTGNSFPVRRKCGETQLYSLRKWSLQSSVRRKYASGNLKTLLNYITPAFLLCRKQLGIFSL